MWLLNHAKVIYDFWVMFSFKERKRFAKAIKMLGKKSASPLIYDLWFKLIIQGIRFMQTVLFIRLSYKIVEMFLELPSLELASLELASLELSS